MQHSAHAQSTAQYSEDRFRSVLSGIETMAVQGYRPDGTITFWNKASEDLYGFTAREIIGKDIVDCLVTRDARDEERRIMAEALRTRRLPDPGQVRRARNDGFLIWVYSSRVLIQRPNDEPEFFSLDVDIHKHKSDHDAVRQSEERFRTLFELFPFACVLTDLEGRYILVNQAFSLHTGYAPEEVIGRTGAEVGFLLPSEELNAVAQQIQQNGCVFGAEISGRTKTGETKHVIFSSRVLAGESPSVLTVTADITERKQAEREKETLEAQLRQAQKMQAVGQLAGGIAHDFNNIIQAIIGYTEVIQTRTSLSPQDAETFEEIHKAASRAADLTRQLLAFSRRQLIRPVNINLDELIRGILKMIRHVIGEDIELNHVPAVSLGTVHVDRGQIEQVLMNLCVNARDAMPAGGVLTIKTEDVIIDDEHCRMYPGTAPGRYALMTVIDSGCGMDEPTRAMVFEPFFTTKEIGKGTGLGLATVYGIVTQHNGFIRVQSELGSGSRFEVFFPVIAEPAQTLAPPPEMPIVGGSETILVAEDETMIRNLVCQVLRTEGYTVLAAQDGQEAIVLFEAHANAIDMALLDVMMPKRGGRQVMEHIRARSPHMRFLFSSGYSGDAAHCQFAVEDNIRFIPKPYHRTDLLRAVRETLDLPSRR